MPWQVQALKRAMEAHMDWGVVWLPPYAKIIEIPGDRVEGGYAKIQRVQISRMENIPSNIDFAGKLPKANKDFDKKRTVHGGPSLSNLTCKCDQILGTSFQYHGSIHVMVEWWFPSQFLGKV